jgi:hypothetical protein
MSEVEIETEVSGDGDDVREMVCVLGTVDSV